MNIIVTIPKNKLAEVEAEEKEVAIQIANGEKNIFYYWTVGTLPKQCPDRIYFVWNGSVRAYHEVTQTVTDFPRNKIYMKPEIHNLKTPIPMKGFQGWRYFDKDVE
jgi:hypothetical protein